jgi:hypothetical protein
MWDPPSYEGLLYSCCIDVVNLTFSFIFFSVRFLFLFLFLFGGVLFGWHVSFSSLNLFFFLFYGKQIVKWENIKLVHMCSLIYKSLHVVSG